MAQNNNNVLYFYSKACRMCHYKINKNDMICTLIICEKAYGMVHAMTIVNQKTMFVK